MKTGVCLRYFVNDFLWKQLFVSNSPQNPSNLNLFTIFVTLRPFTLFYHKLRATKLQKNAKIALLANCFSDLFTDAKIWH